jgi:hypothetical protein
VKRPHVSLASAIWLSCGVIPAFGAGEIVLANRSLQPEGTSHAQLFLYREDGTFLRQLTRDNSGQMIDPIFAPDGETIVFTREMGDHKDFWSIEPRGLNLHQLSQAPEWYAATKDSPLFTNLEQEDGPGPNPDAPSDEQKTISFRSPDGLVEIVLRQTDSEDDQVDGPGHGKHYELRDLKTGKATEFEQLPGFEGVFEILHDSQNKNQHFLIEPPLRLAFFGLHLNSTDGDTCYALNLVNHRLIRLSRNWATPVPLPGEPAFLTWTTERYVAIPKSKKTANCSYFQRWDSNFGTVRYAATNAVICYGASIYRPGLSPAVISVRSGE